MSKEFTKSEKILKISKKANRAISCQPRQACKTAKLCQHTKGWPFQRAEFCSFAGLTPMQGSTITSAISIS
jgi:hypothetical protein